MKKEINPRLGKVGGQAVLEGVMMRSGDEVALSVRKADGTIALETQTKVPLKKKYKILGIPVLRGVINFVETLIMSMQTLTHSAEMLGVEDEEETKFDKWISKHFGKNIYKVVSAFSVVLALVLCIGLFVLVPLYATEGLNKILPFDLGWFKNLIAGLIKIGLFVLYLWVVSLMKEIRRTFEYHGAEHKSIACYEAGLELTPANAKTCTRFHPRCGTSFIFVIFIISILVFSVISWDMNKLAMAGIRIGLLPIVIGISYEIIMIAGKHPNIFTKILTAPGLWLQRITTKEPDESQLEVAIVSLKAAMPNEFPDIREQYTVKETEEEKADDNQND